jgi:hypothetical protein
VPLPATRERAHFIASKIDQQLSRFLSTEEKSTLQSLQSVEILGVDSNLVNELYSRYDDDDSRKSFDLQTCLETAVACTEGWAYRDIGRIVVNVRSEVLGSTR